MRTLGDAFIGQAEFRSACKRSGAAPRVKLAALLLKGQRVGLIGLIVQPFTRRDEKALRRLHRKGER